VRKTRKKMSAAFLTIMVKSLRYVSQWKYKKKKPIDFIFSVSFEEEMIFVEVFFSVPSIDSKEDCKSKSNWETKP